MDKELKKFLNSLEVMKGHADKAVGRNYRKILKKGFRANRKLRCYYHPNGWFITWSHINETDIKWVSISFSKAFRKDYAQYFEGLKMA